MLVVTHERAFAAELCERGPCWPAVAADGPGRELPADAEMLAARERPGRDSSRSSAGPARAR